MTLTALPDVRPVPFGLDETRRSEVCERLNIWLVDLVALSLRLKQAHWNLRGPRFKSIHEQLDEILVDVHAAVDDVAERIVTIGGQADARPRIVAEHMHLGEFPGGPLQVKDAIRHCCRDLSHVVQRGRNLLPDIAANDAVSEDLVLGVLGKLEKDHWLLQSQEHEPA
ncbi:MAG: DNA starvation/stationary phase protection protein [Planctomycetes bacterium]|nr:DNA starvation/stationary phase protection protein [Planctomycetota bacterium]